MSLKEAYFLKLQVLFERNEQEYLKILIHLKIVEEKYWNLNYITNITKILNVYYNLINSLDNKEKKNKIVV